MLMDLRVYLKREPEGGCLHYGLGWDFFSVATAVWEQCRAAAVSYNQWGNFLNNISKI